MFLSCLGSCAGSDIGAVFIRDINLPFVVSKSHFPCYHLQLQI